MLVLSRQRDETIMIGEDIEVTVVDIRGEKVRLSINNPPQVPVHRKEVYEAIKREKASVAKAAVAGVEAAAKELKVVTETAEAATRAAEVAVKTAEAATEIAGDIAKASQIIIKTAEAATRAAQAAANLAGAVAKAVSTKRIQ